MIDIGVNLTNSRFDKDRDDVILRAEQAGISALVITGTNILESQQAAQLCLNYPQNLYSTAGVHPHDADHVSPNYLQDIEALTQLKQVKAIGECGLDFNRNFSHPDQQLKVFSEQVQLAARLNMPLFLHQRDAFEPWAKVLTPYIDKVPAMVSHCFTGDVSQVKQCLAMGMYIGITGWVCDERRGDALRACIPHIPLNRLLIETDAPYLTPRTIRPKPKSSRNEPSYLSYVVDTVSALMSVEKQQVIEHTTANAKRVFGIGL